MLVAFYDRRPGLPIALIGIILSAARPDATVAQERAVGVRDKAREPRNWALIIGVNDYATMPRLKYCVKDATTLADALRTQCGYAADGVYLMVDGLKDFKHIPTRKNILQTAQLVAELPQAEDTLLFYFSGHGVSVDSNGFLVPIDAQKSEAGELVSIGKIRDILRSSKAARRVMVLDACHSGTEKSGGDGTMAKGFEDSLRADAEGVITLASCRANETSLEAPWHDQGLFTYWFVQGMSGAADREEAGNKDGKVEIKELYDYVYERVRSDAASRQRHRQNPFLLASVSGRIDLASVSRTDHPATGIGTPVNPRPTGEAAAPLITSVSKYPLRLSNSGKELSIELGIDKPLECVLISPGEFTMGTAAGLAGQRKDEYPAHRVRIAKSFFLGKHEITNAQFRVFKSDHVTKSPSPMLGGDLNRNDQPAGCISWDDAKSFCEWLSGKTGQKVRLPSESEWEYGCRAGTTAPYPFGSYVEKIGKYAWYWGNSSGTAHAVGKLTSNDWGLFDMLGNIREWCEDTYHDSYTGAPNDGSAWIVEGEDRILRGGAWVSGLGQPNRIGQELQSAYRFKAASDLADASFGFRIVLEIADTSLTPPAGSTHGDRPNGPPSRPSSAGAANASLASITLDLAGGQKLELVRIPSGEFTMGTAATEQNSADNERPQHNVRIEKPFFMGKFEVTQEQWKAVMGTEPYAFRHEAGLPVEQVSWNECQTFCEKASQLLKKEVRLPTEAEWEYACRAGSAKQYGFGNAGDVQGGLGRYTWYGGNSEGKTHPAGSKKPNAFGLHDMHGNVWEWCEDVWHETYVEAPADGRSWSGEANVRLQRGGSWYTSAESCRSSFRHWSDPGAGVNDVGFRVVIEEMVDSGSTRKLEVP